MKKKHCISLLLGWLMFITLTHAQSIEKTATERKTHPIFSSLDGRKDKGFYTLLQAGEMMGSKIFDNEGSRYYPYSTTYAPPTDPFRNSIYAPTVSSNSSVVTSNPSFSISGGYFFNSHWAAGIGMGIDILDSNSFPVFGEIRYTLWDNKLSPFLVLKGGYALGNLKEAHQDVLNLTWPPYTLNDATIRHYGGWMLHPEIGVKLPLSAHSDLLLSAAYRYQKTKSVARKEYTAGQFDEWEHKETITRLSFGIGIMFR